MGEETIQERSFRFLRTTLFDTRHDQGAMSRERYMGGIELYALTFHVKADEVRKQLGDPDIPPRPGQGKERPLPE